MAAPLSVALLRGINVGGNKRVPMAALRALAEGLGWRDVATYIQSGNLVFRASGKPAAWERALETAIEHEFGFPVPVIVRTASSWRESAAGSPFPDAERDRPKLLHLGCSKAPTARGAVEQLTPRCTQGERVAIRGQAIWIDFVEGVARSKLTPAVLDRALGSTVTMRNWTTVQAIASMLAE